MDGRQITLSVVSHRQNALANQLLLDLGRHCAPRVALVLTENLPDPVPLAPPAGVPVQRIANPAVKGFGANHNAAFAQCSTPYFCVCNPDVRLVEDPFGRLLESLAAEPCAVAGPLVRSPSGAAEDSARRFPTAATLLARAFARASGPDYPTDAGPCQVDWVAGMFMLFRTEDYRAAGGFDEAYFMYYEDIDLCRRLGRAGKKVIYDPRAQVVHDARRASRRQPRLAAHHLASILRFLADRR